MALATDDEEEIDAFLRRKRRWLFNAVRELEARAATRPVVSRFATGSKVPYRGRMVRLTVRRHDGPHIEISYRRGLVVDVPSWVRTDSAIATEIAVWLKQRVRRDVREIASVYQTKFDLRPRSIRVADMRGGWGSCGPSGSLTVSWLLIFAPRSVLEYVVAHELAHLKHRSHGRAFWSYLRSIMPSYEKPKAWLEVHQSSLNADFLRKANLR
ncbi:M48 family metallopeptidase [Bradyrhizobium centrolobii]|uniref:M48 family metallopeptidase n=1 Tax=Bradyrhizobium centrolobii TaxID=1505087 RepID=UPI003D314791